jgi:3,5-epimerase/4-reductase
LPVQGFKESDKPNFTGSYYSHCKAMTENMLQAFPNVLTLRVRMPIVADLTYPRNFITKIIKYDKVINIPNSMTVLPELIPLSIEMSKRKLTGIMNYTNPGAISHNEILELYKEYIDPDFTWENFTVEEQAGVIVAPRSNNLLDTDRMKGEFPELLGIKESLIKYVFKPNAVKKEEIKEAVDEMRADFRKPKGNTA